MARHYEDSSTVKTRRQQEDQRRMAFRRAIEDRCEERTRRQPAGLTWGRKPHRKWVVANDLQLHYISQGH